MDDRRPLAEHERVAYRLGVEDARAQVIAALNAERAAGYVEAGGLAYACEVVEALPKPDERPGLGSVVTDEMIERGARALRERLTCECEWACPVDAESVLRAALEVTDDQ